MDIHIRRYIYICIVITLHIYCRSHFVTGIFEFTFSSSLCFLHRSLALCLRGRKYDLCSVYLHAIWSIGWRPPEPWFAVFFFGEYQQSINNQSTINQLESWFAFFRAVQVTRMEQRFHHLTFQLQPLLRVLLWLAMYGWKFGLAALLWYWYRVELLVVFSTKCRWTSTQQNSHTRWGLVILLITHEIVVWEAVAIN